MGWGPLRGKVAPRNNLLATFAGVVLVDFLDNDEFRFGHGQDFSDDVGYIGLILPGTAGRGGR